MARQSNTAIQFNKTVRTDDNLVFTSGRAGVVHPLQYIPLLRGDSASGKVGVDVRLKEMPKALLNGVIGNIQAWFVPKLAHPQFSGMDEFIASYQGTKIKALGAADRDPPLFYRGFSSVGVTNMNKLKNSTFMRTLGVHIDATGDANADVVDAFNLVYNFRLAAHSSKLERRKYLLEDVDAALAPARAFWPSGRYSRVVPDYDSALIVGALDLDIAAGRLPVSGLGLQLGGAFTRTDDQVKETDGTTKTYPLSQSGNASLGNAVIMKGRATGFPDIYAEMADTEVTTTLASIDKARELQSFAKLRQAYAGNDATGFDNDDAIVADLMQGFQPPADLYKRPWLLDSARVAFGMTERPATDGASLDQSVTVGRLSATLSLNVPRTEVGGVIIITLEVLPERLDERQSDEWLQNLSVSNLPDALRDVLREEPVDVVLNRRLDARHTVPQGAYGYEGMNDKWNRSFSRMGGIFYQEDPANPFLESRAGIWITSIVDPALNEDHYLAPLDFPHDVFMDTEGPAFEVVSRHSVSIVGLTQFGDVLTEDNGEYDAVISEADGDA